MKSILFGLLSILFISTTIQAQDIAPAKALKKAGKALSSFNLNPADNSDKLKQAVSMLDIAMTSDELKASPALWLKAGEVYNAVSGVENSAFQIANLKGEGESFKFTDFTSSLKALSAYQQVLKLSPKKFQTKAALKGLQENVGYLNALANAKLAGENADYAGAYDLLEGVNSIRETLISNDKKDIFTEEGAAEQNMLLTAYAANAAGKVDRSKELFGKLVNGKTPSAQVYKMYYDVLSSTDDPKADEVLAAAQAAHPGDKDLLFVEINKLMKADQYDKLEGKLKAAIDAEPENASVRNVMGDVYQRLATSQKEAGNKERAAEYFQSAIGSYEKALELDPTSAYSTYSIGSLYYNDAAAIVPIMNALGTSKAETKQFDALKVEMTALFDKALPYFLKAEAADKNDRNTLIALKEIYARKNDYAKSGEYKKRLEALEKK